MSRPRSNQWPKREKKKMPTVSGRNGLPDARVAFEDRGFWRVARTTE